MTLSNIQPIETIMNTTQTNHLLEFHILYQTFSRQEINLIILFGNGNALSIPLIIYQRSNKNTCMHQKSQVHKGKCVKKGQILDKTSQTLETGIARAM
ncbi:RNA polymerase beta subunit, putative [Medicago truncatula]|uniref:RNA polymerase beta subunit, putative n=1 Tax=Medicago truncatula TaxID=3880 RepID=G7JTK7_MEDTR|nr:RNA polymerase beta subunit, putative [Medicago truncatula]